MKETLKNLTKAFIGESQARNRYTFYSRVAQKEGYEQIGEIFLLTADNEKAHAKRLFEHIQELKKEEKDSSEVTVEAGMPAVYGTTIENLKASIEGENFENTKMYPEFADTAEKEGYLEIAKRLKAIAMAELHHKERYEKLLAQLEAGTVFKKTKETWWVCRECGYIHFGTTPPEACPSCDHPTAFYQVQCENY
ncbi:MAG: rubrerythrin family protein [Candidatus Paceibacterota bacterium]|jgi:rubrerythrin